MERDVKEGGSTTTKAHARRMAIWVIAVIVLLAVVFIPYKSDVGYLDVNGGRGRTITKYLGIKVADTVDDSYLTKLYKKYISEQLPQPDWRYSSTYAHGLTPLARAYGDSFLPRDFNALRGNPAANYYIQNNDFAADDDAWRAILTNFLDILQKHSENSDRGTAVYYVSRLAFIRDEKGKPLTAGDIPSADEEYRRWVGSAR